MPAPAPSPLPVSNLTTSFSPQNPTSVDAVTLSAQNGTPGYTYAKISGAGTLAGNVYAPGASGGAAQFEVTDAAGRKAAIGATMPYAIA